MKIDKIDRFFIFRHLYILITSNTQTYCNRSMTKKMNPKNKSDAILELLQK